MLQRLASLFSPVPFIALIVLSREPDAARQGGRTFGRATWLRDNYLHDSGFIVPLGALEIFFEVGFSNQHRSTRYVG
ncbi:hypothetical protein A9K71_10265 [Mesorhizobium sp. WSM3873]|nr:hypothetical protein A9K71_10265 [Mesorhizobium sp. WSM3873]